MIPNKGKDINIKNKRAEFDYLLLDKYTAGIVLTGTEIKSIRKGKASLVDTYCYVICGEVWVKNMYIAQYEQGSYNNHVERRDRKLLLNRKEIRKKRFVSIAIFLIAPLLIPLVYYLVNLDTKTEFRRNYDEHPQLHCHGRQNGAPLPLHAECLQHSKFAVRHACRHRFPHLHAAVGLHSACHRLVAIGR